MAEGSVGSALRGEQYNRGVHLYKIFYEALMSILITNLSSDFNIEEGLSFFKEFKNEESLEEDIGLKVLYNNNNNNNNNIKEDH